MDDAVFNAIGGNASVSFVLINDNGQSVVAQQRNSNGFIGPVALHQVGRAAVSMSYELLSEEGGYYILEKGLDQSADNSEFSNFVCRSLDTYVWNEVIQIFEYDQALSGQYYTQECS